MTWHLPAELPKPDTEVLAEVEGYHYVKYAVLKYEDRGWCIHNANEPTTLTDIAWFPIRWVSDNEYNDNFITIKRWAYIEEY